MSIANAKSFASFYPPHRLARSTLRELEKGRVNYCRRVTLRILSASKEFVLCEDEAETRVRLQPVSKLIVHKPRPESYLLVRQPYLLLRDAVFLIEIKFEEDVLPVSGFEDGELRVYSAGEAAHLASRLLEQGYPLESARLLEPLVESMGSAVVQTLVSALLQVGRSEEAFDLAQGNPKLQDLVLKYCLQTNGVWDLPSMLQSLFKAGGKVDYLCSFTSPKVQFCWEKRCFKAISRLEEDEIVMVDESLASMEPSQSAEEVVFARLRRKPGLADTLLKYYNSIFGKSKTALSAPDIQVLVAQNTVHVENVEELLLARRPEQQLFVQNQLFRHSCDPNCEMLSFGRVLVVKTRRAVPLNGFVTVNYISKRMKREDRVKYLKGRKIECGCRNCLLDVSEGEQLMRLYASPEDKSAHFQLFRRLLDDCWLQGGMRDLRVGLSLLVLLPKEYYRQGRQLVARRFRGWGLGEAVLEQLEERVGAESGLGSIGRPNRVRRF